MEDRVVKYFQFAIESNYNIGHGGWQVELSNPQYKGSYGYWYLVHEARAVQGSAAYMDWVWVWGGEDYTGVDGLYQQNSGIGKWRLKLSYEGTTLQNGELLWT